VEKFTQDTEYKRQVILMLTRCNVIICDCILEKLKSILCNSHTQALSRHSDNIAIDKQVCFYRPVAFCQPCQSMKKQNRSHGTTRGINGSQAAPLNVCLSAQLVVWPGLLWLFVWPTGHAAWSAVSTSSANSLPTHPLIHGTCDIAGCVQKVSKPATPTSSYIC